MNPEQREHIRRSIFEKYENVSSSTQGQFRYPTGVQGLEGLGYKPEWTAHMPRIVRECFCGVGNPFTMGIPRSGWKVLDVGCGCGVDTLVSAGLVGPDGEAVGLEMTPSMLGKARENAVRSGVTNATFVEGSAEMLPFPEGFFDLVTSSGVYNLVVDKQAAVEEAFRTLKPGGRFQVADQMLTGAPPSCEADRVASWFT